MAYGDKSKVNTEDSASISTLPWGIYNKGKLLGVRKDKAGKDDDKKEVLIFTFANADGQQHDHTEWDAESDEKKQTNQLSRIGSYIRQFHPEFLEFPDVESWDDVRNVVIKYLEKGSDVEVDFKIVANVYDVAKAKTGLPMYKGAVVASSKGTKLSFSTKEQQDNAAFDKIISGGHTGGGSNEGLGVPQPNDLPIDPRDNLLNTPDAIL